MSSTLNNIGIIMMSEARHLLIDIARRLQQQHSSRIHAYVNTAQEAEYYRSVNQDGVFASINDSGVLMRAALDPVDDLALEEAKARHYEELLGENYNTIAVANGHLGRGYVLGGFHYPRSRVMNQTDYGKFLHAYNETFEFWQREISEKNLSLIVNGNKEISCIARANGVPYRSYASARYKMSTMPLSKTANGADHLQLLASPDGVHWTIRVARTGYSGDASHVYYEPFRRKFIFSLKAGKGDDPPPEGAGGAAPRAAAAAIAGRLGRNRASTGVVARLEDRRERVHLRRLGPHV